MNNASSQSTNPHEKKNQTIEASPSHHNRQHAWFLSTAQSLPSERGPETPLCKDHKQRTFSYLFLSMYEHIINRKQKSVSIQQADQCFTYSEGTSRDIQPYWVWSRGTCDSFWNQIPFYQWTRSWKGRKHNITIWTGCSRKLQGYRLQVWWSETKILSNR